ncbi:MAG: rhombotarget lipoprotein [Pseudomonadota bacterium]
MALRTLITALVCTALGGCALFNGPWDGQRRGGASTPLVDFLYPEGEIPPEVTLSVPHLELPLRVGLAFIPDNGRSHTLVDAATREKMLSSVRESFLDLDYVSQIEVIPSTYLRGRGGTLGLQQVAGLYGVDVMALVSYDQISQVFENKQSLLYWTIVGAYVFQGTDHDTRTFVDLAVVDVETGKLLLRAPGFNDRRGDTTLVEANDALRNNSERGFEEALTMLNQNLAVELARFEERMKSEPEDIKVSWRGGRGGGGAADPMLLILGAALVLGRRRAPRQRGR